jgi:Transposase DDE domain
MLSKKNGCEGAWVTGSLGISWKCCPNMASRRIVRDLDEDARDVARANMKTKAFRRSRDERKRVEMRFAHLKTHHAIERLRLRGLSGARDEFHLAAILQNLKTMALRRRRALQRNGISVCRRLQDFFDSIGQKPTSLRRKRMFALPQEWTWRWLKAGVALCQERSVGFLEVIRILRPRT